MHLYYGNTEAVTRNGAIYLYRSRKNGAFIGIFARKNVEGAVYGGEVNGDMGCFNVSGYQLYVISTDKEDYFLAFKDGRFAVSGDFTKVARYIIDNA